MARCSAWVLFILFFCGSLVHSSSDQKIQIPDTNHKDKKVPPNFIGNNPIIQQVLPVPVPNQHGAKVNGGRPVDYDASSKFTPREKKQVALTDAEKNEILEKIRTLDNDNPEKRNVARKWLEERIDDPNQVDGLIQVIQDYSKENNLSVHLDSEISALLRKSMQALNWAQMKFFLTKSIADSEQAKILGQAATKILSNLSDKQRKRLNEVIGQVSKLRHNLWEGDAEENKKSRAKVKELETEMVSLMKIAVQGMETPPPVQKKEHKKDKGAGKLVDAGMGSFNIEYKKDGKTYELSLWVSGKGLDLIPRAKYVKKDEDTTVREPLGWEVWSLDPAKALPSWTRIADTNVPSTAIEPKTGVIGLRINPSEDHFDVSFKPVDFSVNIMDPVPVPTTEAIYQDKTGVTGYLAEKFPYDQDAFDQIKFSQQTIRKHLSVTGK